jgi:hypothetical protein
MRPLSSDNRSENFLHFFVCLHSLEAELDFESGDASASFNGSQAACVFPSGEGNGYIGFLTTATRRARGFPSVADFGEIEASGFCILSGLDGFGIHERSILAGGGFVGGHVFGGASMTLADLSLFVKHLSH